MKTLLERFRELPDHRKCKQLKFNVGEVMYMSLLAILAGANGRKMYYIGIDVAKSFHSMIQNALKVNQN